VITDFVLSDTKGEAILTNVATGEHMLVIEYMGYKPYTKRFFLKEDKKNLGTIGIQEDPERLKAAKVSAAATPMEFRQDTLIYNAAAFKTHQGANLGDLLKKMPGIEVGSDGRVSVNGENVSQITVGGRTFFMGDNSVALNNIPAAAVDKVKVIDKDSDESKFTGVKEKDREKVMDVELKEEYKKGIFGNVSLGLGSSIPSDNQSEYLENKTPLFENSAMVSAYGEKDQLTAIANAANITTGGVAIVKITADDLGEDPLAGNFMFQNGIGPNWNLGANLNSDRMKGITLDASAMYSGSNQHSREISSSTAYQEESGDLDSEEDSYRVQKTGAFKTSVTLKNKNRDKYLFTFEPTLSYNRTEKSASTEGETSSDGIKKNSTQSDTWSERKDFNFGSSLSFGLKNLGKPKRSLTFSGNFNIEDGSGEATEYSSTYYTSTQSGIMKDLVYDSDISGGSALLQVSYVEPISEHWSLSSRIRGSVRKRVFERDAFNADLTDNDYYSAYTNTLYHSTGARVAAQYNKGRTTLNLGLEGRGVNSETVSRSYGMETNSGQGEWNWDLAPYIWASTAWKGFNLNASVNSYSSIPSSTQIMPSFNLSNPVRITLGNIYLKPSFKHSFDLSVSKTFPKSGTSLSLWSNLSLQRNSLVNASWFDGDGIQYLIPVNSPKNNVTGFGSILFSTPLGKDKTLRLSYDAFISFGILKSYQASGTLPGIDTENFDYYSFMDSFWGNESGDIFYGGESGFSQSNTSLITHRHNLRLSKNFEHLTLGIGGTLYNAISRYSLNPDADTDIWRKGFSANALYDTDSGWSFSTDFEYCGYSGYKDGYNYPEYSWSMGIGKTIHSFEIALNVDNILNKHSLREHFVSENLVKDSFFNSLGRTVMLSVKYNFGKAGASQTEAARKAQYKML